MADQANYNQENPLAPAGYNYPRSDAESSLNDNEAKRKKRMKLIAYVSAFAVFQVIVIVVFSLVVMRVQRPKFRVGQIKIQTLTTGSSPASFDMNFVAPIRVKNSNFGPYKYDATNVTFYYGGVPVGRVDVPKSKANFKSTKKIDLNVSLDSSALPSSSSLGSELNSGIITLTSQGKMNGKVELMLIFKKKKSTDMNCTVIINVSSKTVQAFKCK